MATIILNFDKKPETYVEGFAPFWLTIKSSNAISTTEQYYFHKCDKIELQEITEQELAKEDNFETIFFLNDTKTSQVFQPNSSRVSTLDEEEAAAATITQNEFGENEGTLYFIPKES